MRKFIPLFVFMLAIGATQLNAQAPGDTIKVQSWSYSSGNRDTVVSFPTNTNIERVIMRYAMRCKDALVSSTSNRNLGCGEWDYSCNTYIHNPLMADSLERSIDKYQINPSTSDSVFSSVPTFEYRPSLQQLVRVDSIISEDTSLVGNATSTTRLILSRTDNAKSIAYYTAAELSSAGLLAGNISSIEFQSATASAVPLKHLRIGIKQVSGNPFNILDSNTFNSYQNVYYHDYTFNLGSNRIQFHTPFNWDGTSNLLIEFTYEGNSNGPILDLVGRTLGHGLASADDHSLQLFPNNYVQANSYQGIGGSGARTVEAWIKTTTGGEITSWGAATTGAKQAFRVETTSGRIRLEIEGGYIIGSTVVNDGEWHHVAYTFSGTQFNQTKLYVDGALETISSVSSIPMNTALSYKFEISKGFHNRYFDGDIDNIRVFDTEVSGSTIQGMRYRKATFHPNLSNLELIYNIEGNSNTILDQSGNSHHATFQGITAYNALRAVDHFKEFDDVPRPQTIFYQGTYQQSVLNDTIMDTIPQTAYIVEERTVVSRGGTALTDSIDRQVNNYYPRNNQLYDLNGNLVSSTPSTQLATLGQRTLNYYQRNPQKVEIMSFVTPYGINLDLGQDGEAWYFDVSDFMPVLRGNRRMTMERGGQWQEEMDIQFYFIVGTPPADVKSIQEVWKVDQRPYASINNNTYFAPVTIPIDSSARSYKIRSAITGHGQQGEFIPRTHTITVNTTPFSRGVWKECAENPVYPQGGTWIYDRAGWCPGMATDVEEYNITSLVQGNQSATIDYNVIGASGTSNYIVSTQLVQYGAPNFTNDARIENIIRPNAQTEFGRRNPSCFNPSVVIRNTGSANLTSATIEVSINGGSPFSFNWNGNLGFMDETSVGIPVPVTFWSAANLPTNTFTARITGVNNGSDQYIHNNVYNSRFSMPDTLPSQFRLIIKTNNRPNENSISIVDHTSTVMFTRNTFPTNSTTGNVINLTPGCYQLRLNDSNDDGLTFFANPSAGSGYFRIEDMNFGVLANFNPDFGDRVEYYFSVISGSTGLEENELTTLELYPNPTEGSFNISYSGGAYNWTLRNSMGQIVKSRTDRSSMNAELIRMDELSKGIYYLSIESENETLLRKVIKQ